MSLPLLNLLRVNRIAGKKMVSNGVALTASMQNWCCVSFGLLRWFLHVPVHVPVHVLFGDGLLVGI